jgi:hypothetical protein
MIHISIRLISGEIESLDTSCITSGYKPEFLVQTPEMGMQHSHSNTLHIQ